MPVMLAAGAAPQGGPRSHVRTCLKHPPRSAAVAAGARWRRPSPQAGRLACPPWQVALGPRIYSRPRAGPAAACAAGAAGHYTGGGFLFSCTARRLAGSPQHLARAGAPSPRTSRKVTVAGAAARPRSWSSGRWHRRRGRAARGPSPPRLPSSPSRGPGRRWRATARRRWRRGGGAAAAPSPGTAWACRSSPRPGPPRPAC
mmetsp:Transcript_84387/g.239350  ORF Transcript_84387/g.239350 Transcript_84387/m.239350 type:complete len:201 (+) Transcript_84387:32-634(+)